MHEKRTEHSEWPGPLPAVAIGGPPHSGKSVLVYSLTQALREKQVPHYVLRACPDGEGDWSNEADQDLVKTIRLKGDYSPLFIERVVENLRPRRVPMLVDVGGKPRRWQEVVFDHCTHAILLIGQRADDPTAYQSDLAHWTEMMERHDLPLIARLKSVLGGENTPGTTTPLVTGVLSDLERGKSASGPVFDALVNRLRALFLQTIDAHDLDNFHLQRAPVEIALHLPRLARTLGSRTHIWQPRQLSILCEEYLPAGKPLALYGRAAIWVYAALAQLAAPADIWLFDTRLGWVAPPSLPITDQPIPAQAGWQVTTRPATAADAIIVEMARDAQYLSLEHPEQLPMPTIPHGSGVILSGTVPNWLIAAAVRQYAPQSRWLAVFYPQENKAIVVYSKDDAYRVGDAIPL